jgi:hypothetical protein
LETVVFIFYESHVKSTEAARNASLSKTKVYFGIGVSRQIYQECLEPLPYIGTWYLLAQNTGKMWNPTRDILH